MQSGRRRVGSGICEVNGFELLQFRHSSRRSLSKHAQSDDAQHLSLQALGTGVIVAVGISRAAESGDSECFFQQGLGTAVLAFGAWPASVTEVDFSNNQLQRLPTDLI